MPRPTSWPSTALLLAVCLLASGEGRAQTPTSATRPSRGAVGGAPTADAGAPPTNLLFVSIDDLNNDLFLPQVVTPHLDSLAQRGVRFTRAYAAHPLCLASRVAMMSGRATHHTEVVFNSVSPPATGAGGVAYMPQRLRDAGYHVVGVGKLFHHDPQPVWDEYAEFVDDPWIAQPPSPGVQGLVYHGPFENGPDGSLGSQADDHRVAYTIDRLVEARHRIQTTGQPFALWLGLEATHDPFLWPEALADAYTAADVPPLPTGEGGPWKTGVSNQTWKTQWFFDPATGATEDERRVAARLAYFRCITRADQLMGQVLTALDVLGLADTTLVVVLGDHGWSFGEHDHIGKTTGFDEDIVAPLLVAAPTLAAGHGATVDTPVSQLDVYPTVMEQLGLAPPAGLDGTSLVPLLTDAAAAHPAATYTTDEQSGFNLTRHAVMRDPATGHVWKLAHWERDDNIPQTHQLYDLTADPGEYDNRYGEPGLEALTDGLRAELAAVGLYGPMNRHYSTGVAGTLGLPGLDWSVPPVLGVTGDLVLGNGRGSDALSLLLVGFSGSLPGPKVFSVVPLVEILLPVPAAGLSLPLTLPADPAFADVPVGLQLVQADPAAPHGMSRSRGLVLVTGL